MTINGISGHYAQKSFPVDRVITFGRSPDSCNILFPDNVRGISRTHCKVEATPTGAIITDLGSSYGTFLNGNKLQPYTPVPLGNGDTFYLADKGELFTFSSAKYAPAVRNQYTEPDRIGGTPVQDQQKSKVKWIIGISAAVAAVLLIAMISGIYINRAEDRAMQAEQQARDAQNAQQQAQYAQQQAQDALNQERNKGPLERTFETIDSWIDVFK